MKENNIMQENTTIKKNNTARICAEYKRELNQIHLILQKEGRYQEDYQIRMLRENQVKGLLPVRSWEIDDMSICEYDISGKQSVEKLYERKGIKSKEMKELLNAILSVIEEMDNYLLNANSLLLDPAYVFWEKEEYFFCYCPFNERDVRESFHKLTEFFVQHTDYQDVDSVKLSFFLHKNTMEENYSLRKIMEKMEQEEENAKEKAAERRKGRNMDMLFQDTTCEDAEQDWIACQEMGNNIMKETDNLWTPVRRFLQKRRKPKWGDFDGIYIDEEEFY